MQEVRTNRSYPVARTAHVDTETTVMPAFITRISWGAVLGGVFISLISMVALNLLGLSIGANTINPTTEINPLDGLGTGAVIWLAATTLLSLFAGGYVASRMSGVFNDQDGILHGLVTWAVVGMLSLALLTSSVGSIINGLSNVISTGLGAAGQAISDVSPEVAQALELQSFTLEGIQNDVREMMNQTAAATQTNGENGTTQAAQTSTFAQAQVNASILRFLNLGEVTEADREELTSVLVANTSMNEQEARATLDQWEQTYVQLRTDAEETIEQAGQVAADMVAMIAGVLFAALLVGGFAAGMGGLIGVPEPEELIPDEVVHNEAVVH